MKLAIALALLSSVVASGADDFFSSKIEPILRERCYECHSHAKKMKGGLTLDSKLRNFAAYAQKNGLAALCRVLINSNEFLFVN